MIQRTKPDTRSTVRALGAEAWGVARYAAMYPFGIRRGRTPCGPCDAERPPVVGVHGYFHNRSAYYYLRGSLRGLGFGHVSGFNYSPFRAPIGALAERLGRYVDEVRDATGSPVVHLVGHSLGGLVARSYIQDHGGADVVDRCVTVGTPHLGTFAAYCGVGPAARDMRPGSAFLYALSDGFRPGAVAHLNIYSDNDVLIVPASSARLPETAGVVNVAVRDVGHASMLIARQTTEYIGDFLCGQLTPLAVDRAKRKGRRADARPSMVRTEEIDETVG